MWGDELAVTLTEATGEGGVEGRTTEFVGISLHKPKKKRLTVMWSARCKEVPFWGPFNTVFDTFCPGKDRCAVKSNSVITGPKPSKLRIA